MKRFRVMSALRATIASVMALTVNALFDLSFGYVSVLTPQALLLLHHNQEIDYGLQRVVGPSFAILVAVVLLFLVGNAPFLVALLFVVLLIVNGMVFAQGQFKYGAIFSFITFGVLLFAMMTDPQTAETVAVHWVWQIYHGVFWAWLMVAVILPFVPATMVRRRLGAILQDQSTRLTFLSERKQAAANYTLARYLRKSGRW